MRRPWDWRRVARCALVLAATLAARPATAFEAGNGVARPVAVADGGVVASGDAPARPERAQRPRPSGFPWPGGSRSADGGAGWSGTACLALVLAACGGIVLAARRFGPRTSAGAVQVVGRVGLSSRHSVHLVRVGRRVLVVGTGPQGPPSLIAELDDAPEDRDPPAPHREAAS